MKAKIIVLILFCLSTTSAMDYSFTPSKPVHYDFAPKQQVVRAPQVIRYTVPNNTIPPYKYRLLPRIFR